MHPQSVGGTCADFVLPVCRCGAWQWTRAGSGWCRARMTAACGCGRWPQRAACAPGIWARACTASPGAPPPACASSPPQSATPSSSCPQVIRLEQQRLGKCRRVTLDSCHIHSITCQTLMQLWGAVRRCGSGAGSGLAAGAAVATGCQGSERQSGAVQVAAAGGRRWPGARAPTPCQAHHLARPRRVLCLRCAHRQHAGAH